MTKRKATPNPKQERAKDTVELVLTATDAALREGGEASIRIQDISNSTGTSVGSIYHHFGDRDGLIRATYVLRFEKSIKEDIRRAKNFMERMHSVEEIGQHYDEMIAFLNNHFLMFPAREQANVIGNTAGRPLLREAIIEVQNELTNGFTEVMQLLQDRKMLKQHLTPRAAAVMALGMLHGRVIAEFDRTPVSDQEWNQAMLSAFGGLFILDDQLNV